MIERRKNSNYGRQRGTDQKKVEIDREEVTKEIKERAICVKKEKGRKTR